MAKKNKSDGNGFAEKLMKKLPTGFAEDAEAMSEEELKKVIIDSENSINEVEKERDADIKLNAAKELSKELGKAYSETKSAQMAKIKYALYLLEGQGKI